MTARELKQKIAKTRREIEEISAELDHNTARRAEIAAKRVAADKIPLKKRFLSRLSTERLEKIEAINKLYERVWRLERMLNESEG